MDNWNPSKFPPCLEEIEARTRATGFSMASDRRVGSLLRTLAVSRPGGRFLELGTGTGHALAWLADGMDKNATLVSIDNDPGPMAVARHFFGKDKRISLLCEDAAHWIQRYEGEGFDLVFADAWPGKYSHLGSLLSFIRAGGLYLIDDLLEQSNWPEGHASRVAGLIRELRSRDDFVLTEIGWSTGILLASRKSN